jgi:hypothetical protein
MRSGREREQRVAVPRRLLFIVLWITRCLGIEWPESSSRELSANIPETSRGSWFQRRRVVLYTIAVILLILWLLGFVSGYTIGAFMHVLLVVAIVLFLVGLLSGRRVV